MAGLESLVRAVELGVCLLDQRHPQGPVPARARGVTRGNQTQTHTRARKQAHALWHILDV